MTLVVTPASAWKKATEVVQFPSGKVAELQKPDMLDLVMGNGNIPDSLLSIVLENIQGGGSSGVANWSPQKSDLAALREMVNALTRSCFVNPQVVDGTPKREEGEIVLADIDDADKFFLLTWATGGAPAAEQFPPQPVPSVSPAPNGEGVQAAANSVHAG